MRFMGDATPATPAIPALPTSPGALDAAARAQLLAQASQLPDDQAQLFVDVAAATPLGHRKMIMCYGLGAVGGAVVAGLGVFLLTRK